MKYLSWHSPTNHLYDLVSVLENRFWLQDQRWVSFFVFQEMGAIVSIFLIVIKCRISLSSRRWMYFGCTFWYNLHSSFLILIWFIKCWTNINTGILTQRGFARFKWNFVFEWKTIIICIDWNKMLFLFLIDWIEADCFRW